MNKREIERLDAKIREAENLKIELIHFDRQADSLRRLSVFLNERNLGLIGEDVAGAAQRAIVDQQARIEELERQVESALHQPNRALAYKLIEYLDAMSSDITHAQSALKQAKKRQQGLVSFIRGVLEDD